MLARRGKVFRVDPEEPPRSRSVVRRVTGLCDNGEYEELFPHDGSVYLCARGRVAGRPAVVIAVDPEPASSPPDLTGSLERVLQCLSTAETERCPVVFLFDAPGVYSSGRTAFQGANLELLMGKRGMGRLYFELGRLVRKVPILGAVFGRMAQSQAFPVAMCRALVMLKGASLTVARPDTVKAMLGEDVDYQELGGFEVHSRYTGICDEVVGGEGEALAWLGSVIRFLPGDHTGTPPAKDPRDVDAAAPPLSRVIPDDLNQPFEARRAIEAIVDGGSFVELGRGYAREMVIGLAHAEGMTCGLVVSNPQVRGGLLFPETCRKVTRFIRFMDDFNLPLVFLADAPGFMFGTKAERGGIVSAGAELFEAIAGSSVPRLCVILRRAYSAGLYAVSGSGFQPDRLLALPGASITVYGPEAVEELLKGLGLPPERESELRRRMEEEHSLGTMLEGDYLDGVVLPESVREEIARFLKGSGAEND